MTTSSDHTSNPSTAIVEGTLNLQTLASIRSLIINPSTSKPSLSSIFQTLTRPLQHNHHTLKLLSDLAFHHPDFSPLIIDTVRSHSAESTRVSAESLDLLASLCPTLDWLDDLLFVSLCFGPSVSVRLWLLKNAERFHVRPYLLVPALLGFTKDPYPYVRKVALDGLVGICKSGVLEDRGMIEGCYCRAVELVCDMEDCVRSAAVRAVSEWGQMLVSSSQETNKRDWSDALFVQLCSIVRDMNMEVRVEAFDAIGKIGIVSEDILLQSLSKKVLGITKEKKCLGKFAVGNSEVSASSAAGAFVHGLEDEYYQFEHTSP